MVSCPRQLRGGGGGIRGKNNSTNYHRRGAGGNNGIYDERQRGKTLLPAPPPSPARSTDTGTHEHKRAADRYPRLRETSRDERSGGAAGRRGAGLCCWEIPRAANSQRQTLARPVYSRISITLAYRFWQSLRGGRVTPLQFHLLGQKYCPVVNPPRPPRGANSDTGFRDYLRTL